jgi:hypothetical protein
MIEPRDIDLLELLTTWCGPPTKMPVSLPSSCDWLPQPLKEWHVLASRWEAPPASVTSMISPDLISVVDGKAIFMVDSTGDWRWCFDPDVPDSVFDAELYEPWEQNPEPLEVLLIHRAVVEVFYSATARMRAFAVSDEALAQIVAPLEEVAFGAWRWPAPGNRSFMSDKVLAEVVGARSGAGWDVEVVATRSSYLSELESLSAAQWRKQNC